MYKPFMYLVEIYLVTYFLTNLPIYETYYFLQNRLRRWNQILTQLRFIHNRVIMGIQWMSDNEHPMDGALVGARVLWPIRAHTHRWWWWLKIYSLSKIAPKTIRIYSRRRHPKTQNPNFGELMINGLWAKRTWALVWWTGAFVLTCLPSGQKIERDSINGFML